MKHLTIDADFIDCPDCFGLGNRIDNEGCRWRCESCQGDGRIYFTDRTITMRQRLAGWWENLPRYKRINLYTAALFVPIFFICLFILNLLENAR